MTTVVGRCDACNEYLEGEEGFTHCSICFSAQQDGHARLSSENARLKKALARLFSTPDSSKPLYTERRMNLDDLTPHTSLSFDRMRDLLETFLDLED